MQQFAYEGFDDDSDEEGFDDDDEEFEGFEDDSDDEGFDDDDEEFEGFEDDSDNEEGFKSKSKARKALEKSNKAIAKSAKKTGKAIKNSKAGKAISKAAKKTDKALGISKAAKKLDKAWGISKKANLAAKRAKEAAKRAKRKIIDPALTRAQMQAQNAMQQLSENNKALNSAQNYAAQVKASVEKQIQNPNLKAFNKIDVNKKSASIVFIGFALVAVLIVFGLYFIKYSDSYVSNIISEMNTQTKPGNNIFMNVSLIIVIIFVIVFFSVIFKGLILKNDINKSHVMKVLTTVLTIGLPIIGITVLTINNLPLMMRTFENTFGYWWIGGDKLKKITQKVFGGDGNYNDYSIITTQLFEENFKYYLTCMKKDSPVDPDININRFRNVFIDKSYFDENGKIKMRVPDKDKPDEKVQDLYDLLKMVVRKRHVSVATWVSFSVIATLYTSHLVNVMG